jgi:uncharacterized protein YqjF (DUF2071 family)
MTEWTQDIDRISPTERPARNPAGYQRWSNLLFLHWPVPADEIRPLIPERLDVDTYEGKAWVGIVLFEMSGVRPWWFPPVPWVSSFPEFNVRTYVHRGGEDPGVWFFSLDAARSIAVLVARWRWKLPYYKAAMQVRRRDERLSYHSERLWPGEVGPGVHVEAEFGDWIVGLEKGLGQGHARPGTFEHFLAERYLLFCEAGGKLLRGQVHHTPYPLRDAEVLTYKESLLAACGLPPAEGQPHSLFSEGVSVEVFPLEAL